MPRKSVTSSTPAAARDPVVALAELVVEAFDEALVSDRLEMEAEKDSAERLAFGQWREAARLRQEGLEAAIAATPATSLEGALIQARLIFSNISDLSFPGGGGVRAPEQDSLDHASVAALSIITALEAETGIARAQWYGHHYVGAAEDWIAATAMSSPGDGDRRRVAHAASSRPDPSLASAETATRTRSKPLAALFAEYLALVAAPSPDGNVPDAVGERISEIEGLIAGPPSATLAEAQVKAELLAYFQRYDLHPRSDNPAGQLAAGLARDLKRLARGAS